MICQYVSNVPMDSESSLMRKLPIGDPDQITRWDLNLDVYGGMGFAAKSVYPTEFEVATYTAYLDGGGHLQLGALHYIFYIHTTGSSERLLDEHLNQ